jgi:hypothetical protein
MLQESKEYMKLFNSWRRCDTQASIYAILGLILAITNYEIDLYYQRIDPIFYTND